jgi:cell division protein FtsW
MKPKFSLRNLVNQGVVGLSHMVRTVFVGQSKEFKILIFIVTFMVVFGATMVLSSSYVDSAANQLNPFGELWSQLVAVAIGAFLLLVFAFLKPETVGRLALIGMGLGLFLEGLVLFTPLGVEINGNRNWLDFGFSLQPSELLKIAMIVYVAKLIMRPKSFERDDYRFWMPPALVFSFVAILVGWFGKDVGTVIVMAMILFGMFYMAGLPWKYVGGVIVAAAIAVPLLMVSSASRLGRVMAWLNPNAPDPNGYNWQSTHGEWAFASGGFFGTGLGKSKMKWSWIPEAQNDFIFAIVGEEWGLIGALGIIALFVAMGSVMFRIAAKAQDPYQKLVVYGVTFWIMSQAFINISVVLTMFPVLGVNLPLISAGGTSMLASLIAIGLVLGIDREISAKISRKSSKGLARR